MASRGSVIPLFVSQILGGKAVSITDPNMTRFMMTLDDAVNLVLYAFKHGQSGDIFVQKSPATTISILTKALVNLMNAPGHEIKIIGTRHGEKLYEVLLSREEMVAAQDLGDYYRIPPDLRDLSYSKFVDQGEIKISDAIEYNSHNTTQLDIKKMQDLLMKLQFIQAITKGDHAEPEE